MNEFSTADIVCEGVGGGSDQCAKYCRDLGVGYNNGKCDGTTCRCY